MNYQQILLCYFRQQPFVSLTNPDRKQQLFQLGMMKDFVENYIAQLHLCIQPLVSADDESLQSQLGFEMGVAQIILEKIQAERRELMNMSV